MRGPKLWVDGILSGFSEGFSSGGPVDKSAEWSLANALTLWQYVHVPAQADLSLCSAGTMRSNRMDATQDNSDCWGTLTMQRLTLVLGAFLVAITSSWAWTQESGKPTAPTKVTAKADAAPEEEKTTGRLPNNYGKLSLTEKQKKSIYAAQTKYAAEINALIKQVEELRGKRDAEVEGVLTAEQKAKLLELQSETAKRTAAKKATAKPPAE